MYRLAGLCNEDVQRVISNELFHAFSYFFEFKKDEIYPDADTVEEFLEFGYNIEDATDEEIEAFCKKIQKMSEELIDPDNEYTFDLYGESILCKVLYYIHENEVDYGPEFWSIVSSEEDVEKVKSIVKEYIADTYENISDECYDPNDEEDLLLINKYKSKDFQMKQAEILAKRIYFVPNMIFEITNEDNLDLDQDLLFWDRDFTLIDRFNAAQIQSDRFDAARIQSFVDTFGDMMGREKYSGSIKMLIKE